MTIHLMIISADIGGTKTNIGISGIEDPINYTRQRTFLNENFESFADVVQSFADPTEIEIMVLGIAGPVKSRVVGLTNLYWSIDADYLADTFSCDVFLLNDLQAAAYSISYLNEKDIEKVYTPSSKTDSDVEVIAAAGTGLGVAKIYHGSSKMVFSSEGGHIGLSPQSDFQHAFFDFIQQKNHHVSYEMSVSSIGYNHLRDFLIDSDYFTIPEDFLTKIRTNKDLSRLISERAGSEGIIGEICQTILDEFSLMLGAFLGDLALVHLPQTVYLTGGIGRNISIPNKLKEGFLNKANMTHVVEKIGLNLISDPDCGLHGCSWFAKEYLQNN